MPDPGVVRIQVRGLHGFAKRPLIRRGHLRALPLEDVNRLGLFLDAVVIVVGGSRIRSSLYLLTLRNSRKLTRRIPR